MKLRRSRPTDPGSDVDVVARALGDGPDRSTRLASALRTLSAQAGRAGSKAVVSGQWLTDTVLRLGEHLPVRDHDTLVAHHGGKDGPELVDALVRNAAVASGAVGATGGAIIGGSQLLPPTWATVPVTLAAETALVVMIEMKLVAELHEAVGRPIPGSGGVRGLFVAQSWAEKRGVKPQDLVLGVGAVDVFGRQARNTLTMAVRRRLTHRLGRSMASLIPLMAGAAAGAVLNRRATLAIGQTVAGDLFRQDAVPADVVELRGRWA